MHAKFMSAMYLGITQKPINNKLSLPVANESLLLYMPNSCQQCIFGSPWKIIDNKFPLLIANESLLLCMPNSVRSAYWNSPIFEGHKVGIICKFVTALSNEGL